MSDRAEFEEWADREWPKMHLDTKGDTGEYLYKTAEFAWQAWQAARSQGGEVVESEPVAWMDFSGSVHASKAGAEYSDAPATPLYTHSAPSQAVPDGLLAHLDRIVRIHEEKGIVLTVDIESLKEMISANPPAEGEE